MALSQPRAALLVSGCGLPLAGVGGGGGAGLFSSGRAGLLLCAQAIGGALQPEQNVSKAVLRHTPSRCKMRAPVDALSETQPALRLRWWAPTEPSVVQRNADGRTNSNRASAIDVCQRDRRLRTNLVSRALVTARVHVSVWVGLVTSACAHDTARFHRGDRTPAGRCRVHGRRNCGSTERNLVDDRRIELLTSALRTRRSPS